MDWLQDFVDYGSFGEASPRLLYWTGVSSIAGALRRKVWIDMGDFQWTPNFYIVIVGPPGVTRKSTTMDVGINLLKMIGGIHFGPDITTWQGVIKYITENNNQWPIPDGDGELFPMCCVTLALSELGTFLDPQERNMIDNLTNMWDGKLGSIKKMTSTNGIEELVNPFINIIAATTPTWLSDNFPASMVGGGFASRCIMLYEKGSDKEVAYPGRNIPATREATRRDLIGRLHEMAQHYGPYQLTEAAYEYGTQWYSELRQKIRNLGDSLEAGFVCRKQVHLHKVAMVISASKGKFPVIDVEDLQEADARLNELTEDTRKIFGFVGQTKVTKAAREMMEIITRKPITRNSLYSEFFFRTMSRREFDESLDSIMLTRTIEEQPGVGLRLRQQRSGVHLVK